ncbi:unnamed protein product, partial [Mesorhabditis belari]|uniref:Headcase N-terminal domain-containing protein n=1 Tax=Mesorhabditis belari TaxID=2138241 RepID=A0AAF3F7Z1_9BILA
MGRRPDSKRAVTKDARTSPSPRPTPRTRRGPPPKIGCPIPEPLDCLVGALVGEDEEGRMLCCTNPACPHMTTLVHDRCMDAFEEHLVKILQNSGSARGWTDGQRRQNLWEKKGQALVGKVCRCRCGGGVVVRDENHDTAREKREKQALEAQKGIKKKRVKRESGLPRLNYGTKGQTLFPEPRAKGRTQLPSESESEISSFTSEYVASRRESMALYKDTEGWATSSLNGTNFHDSVDETGDEYYKFNTPPPSAVKRTFSDATQHRSLTTPLTVQTENITPASGRHMMRSSCGGVDSGIEIKSGATSVSGGDACTPTGSAQNSPPGHSNIFYAAPCTTRHGRRFQTEIARNKPSKSPPIVPGGTPAWRPLTPLLPPITGGGFDTLLGPPAPLSPLEEIMRGLSQYTAKGDSTMIDSAFARVKPTTVCDSSPLSGRLSMDRPPAIPALMSLQMTPPPEFVERHPLFTEDGLPSFSPVSHIGFTNCSNKAGYSRLNPAHPVSISKKITGGSHFETATSNEPNSTSERRSVTPINWEDELPPEWANADTIPRYHLRSLDNRVFLGIGEQIGFRLHCCQLLRLHLCYTFFFVPFFSSVVFL